MFLRHSATAVRPQPNPRRLAAIRTTGRILAAALPAAAFCLFLPDIPLEQRLFAAGVQAAVWGASVVIGHSLVGPALTALGPRIAVGRVVLIGLVTSTAASTWLSHSPLTPERTVLLACCVFVTSAAWETFALRRVTPAVRLLLVGTSLAAETLAREIRRGRGGGYELLGTVRELTPDDPKEDSVPVLGGPDRLDTVIAEHRPDLVVLASTDQPSELFVRLLDAAEAGFRVIRLAEFYEYAFGRVPIEDLSHDWFMSVLHLYQRPYSQLAKRTLDLVCAVVLLLFMLPLFPLLALAVAQTEGPLILRQVRLGRHGKAFTIYKFRTMHADAEASGRAVWADANDPRVTPVGGIMRRLRLDELPQLWNVIRGEMAIVGPRPERPEFVEELTRVIPHWTRRHLVKPGLTGWAQVRQGYTASAEATSTKLSYDFWYLRHRSLLVDLAILLRTAFVVFGGDKAAAVPARRSRPATAQESS